MATTTSTDSEPTWSQEPGTWAATLLGAIYWLVLGIAFIVGITLAMLAFFAWVFLVDGAVGFLADEIRLGFVYLLCPHPRRYCFVLTAGGVEKGSKGT